MKKLIKTALVVMLLLTTYINIPNNVIEVSANGCEGNYELATANSDGSFTTVQCYSNFNEANDNMSNSNHVVRHNSSLSPSKIIAIKEGVAFSYPRRSGNTTTQNVYQYENYNTSNAKKTYVVQHRQLEVFETVSYNGSGNGKVHVNMNGFDGYTDLNQLDLVPLVFLENNVVMSLGGNTKDGNPEYAFNVNVKQNHYKVEQNGNYADLVYYYYSGWANNSNTTQPAEYKIVVGPAPSFMSVGNTYYSYDTTNYYSDRNYSNKVGEYYNYYMFLPFRSQSNVSASTYNKYLAEKGFTQKPASSDYGDLGRHDSLLYDEGQSFINSQNTYGTNALLTFAMAINESGNGRSKISIEKNNLFGWNAYDASPGDASKYPSAAASIEDQMAINLRGYMDVNDGRFYGTHAGNKGSGFNVKYASDPYWSQKLSAIAYDIDKLDNNDDGSLTDHNAYDLAVIPEYKTPIKKSASDSSSNLYTSEYGSTYQQDHIVITHGNDGTYTKIQSTNIVDSNGNIVNHKTNNAVTPKTGYDFNQSIGYVKNSQLKMIVGENISTGGTVPTGAFVFNVGSMSVNENGLSLSGNAYRPGIYVTDTNTITHKLFMYDSKYAKTEIALTSSVSEKEQASFSLTNYDINGLNAGMYYFEIASSYSTFSDYNQTSNVLLSEVPSEFSTKTKKFVFENMGSNTWMTVSDIDQVDDGDDIEKLEDRVVNVVKQFGYKDDTNILQIGGYAFITNYDAVIDSNIKHELILYDLVNKTEIIYNYTPTIHSSSVNLGDGKDYQKMDYIFEVNMEEVPPSDYSLKYRITNGDVTKIASVFNNRTVNTTPTKNINDNFVSIKQNSMFGYRYDISFNSYDPFYEELINKPTKRNSKFVLREYDFEENTLKLQGESFIFNTNFSDESQQEYKFILVDENGNQTVVDAGNSKSDIDYSEILNTKYDYSIVDFEASIDLTGLKPGKYEVFIDITNGEYRDIFQINKTLRFEPKTHVVGDITYTLTTPTSVGNIMFDIIDKSSSTVDVVQPEEETQDTVTDPKLPENGSTDIENPDDESQENVSEPVLPKDDENIDIGENN